MSYEGMLKRFKGMTKQQMIDKYNSPNCAPMWDKVQRQDAKDAIKAYLEGTVPNEKVVESFEAEIMKMPETVVEVKKQETAEEIFEKELAPKQEEAPEVKDDLDLSMLEEAPKVKSTPKVVKPRISKRRSGGIKK